MLTAGHCACKQHYKDVHTSLLALNRAPTSTTNMLLAVFAALVAEYEAVSL
jgi:hypothetical protein